MKSYLRTTYITVPQYFTFIIKRYDKGKRLNTRITISDNLIIDNSLGNERYKILAIIIHKGQAKGGGHYYCYRMIWNDTNTTFNIYKLDDSSASEVELQNIKDDIETNGYVFLCEKI